MHKDNRRDIDHLARKKTSEPASESLARGTLARRIGYTLFRRVWARRRVCIRIASPAEVAAPKTQPASPLRSTFHSDQSGRCRPSETRARWGKAGKWELISRKVETVRVPCGRAESPPNVLGDQRGFTTSVRLKLPGPCCGAS